MAKIDRDVLCDVLNGCGYLTIATVSSVYRERTHQWKVSDTDISRALNSLASDGLAERGDITKKSFGMDVSYPAFRRLIADTNMPDVKKAELVELSVPPSNTPVAADDNPRNGNNLSLEMIDIEGDVYGYYCAALHVRTPDKDTFLIHRRAPKRGRNAYMKMEFPDEEAMLKRFPPYLTTTLEWVKTDKGCGYGITKEVLHDAWDDMSRRKQSRV